MAKSIHKYSVTLALISLATHSNVAFAQSRVTGTGKIYPHSAQTTSPEEGEKLTEDEARSEESQLEGRPQDEYAGKQLQEEQPPELPSLEEGGRLELVCGGAGGANKQTMVTESGSFRGNLTRYGHQLGAVDGSTNTTYHGTRRDGFSDEVALFIEGSEGRLRMPRAMLPPVRGGENGWFKLGNIRVKENEITATVRVNFMNNPKMRIDRYTGGISISGKAGDYSGQCQRILQEETQRQF